MAAAQAFSPLHPGEVLTLASTPERELPMTPRVYEHLILHAIYHASERVESELAVRSATCGRCGKSATLRTQRIQKRIRLFLAFVVQGGVRIRVDHCSECDKEDFSVDQRRWNLLRQAAHAAARAEIAHPLRRPEHWLDEHRARLAFGDEAGAADLAYQLAMDPRATADVHAELALTQKWQGHVQSSAESERRARRLDPSGEALWAITIDAALARGDADTALKTLQRRPGRLEHLRQGALRRLLFLLARRGRWRELHALLAELIARFPHVAFDADVRRFVRKANRRVDGARPLALPRLPGEYRVRNLSVAAACVVTTAFTVAELYARAHRPVWMVSARPGAWDVSIDGRPFEHFQGRGVWPRHLSCGEHSIVISGARSAECALTIGVVHGFALFDDGAHVVDLAGDALLRVEPTDGLAGGPPLPSPVHYGRDTYTFHRLERAFGEYLGGHDLDALFGVRTGRLALLSTPPIQLAMQDASAGKPASALALLDDRIRRTPCDANLLMAYAWTAAQMGARTQALDRLAPFLEADPLVPAAHDAARYVLTEPDAADRLRAVYASRLARDDASFPSDTAARALVVTAGAPPGTIAAKPATERATAGVLRAHLCVERDEALLWLARARAADPSDVRALRHSADLVAGVDWSAALAFAEEGLALDVHDAFLLDVRSGARLALGQAAELERELRAELEVHPRHQERQGRLAELLVATGRSTELDLYIGEQERVKGFGEQGAGRLRVLAMEAGGRLEELAATPLDRMDEQRTRWQMLALCELGRGAEFERRVGREQRVVDRWYDALVIELCFRLAGDEGRARLWHARTLQRLAAHSDQAEVARLLASDEAPSLASIRRLALGAHETAVLLLAAAQRAEGVPRAQLLEAATRFHPWPGHVQRLIRRLSTGA